MDQLHLRSVGRIAGPLKRVRLIRKFAPILNGIDLSRFRVGDVIWVSDAVAAMLIAEGWAELVSEPPPPSTLGRETRASKLGSGGTAGGSYAPISDEHAS